VYYTTYCGSNCCRGRVFATSIHFHPGLTFAGRLEPTILHQGFQIKEVNLFCYYYRGAM